MSREWFLSFVSQCSWITYKESYQVIYVCLCPVLVKIWSDLPLSIICYTLGVMKLPFLQWYFWCNFFFSEKEFSLTIFSAYFCKRDLDKEAFLKALMMVER